MKTPPGGSPWWLALAAIPVLAVGFWVVLVRGDADTVRGRGGASRADGHDGTPVLAGPGPRQRAAGARRMPPPKLLSTSIGPTYRSIADAWRANARDPKNPRPVELHAQQLRNEEWASAMEDRLKARFDPERLGALGLTTMTLDAVDCRESICRFSFSWGEPDQATTRKTWPSETRPPDAGVLLTMVTGPFAAVETRLRPQTGEVVVPDSWHLTVRPDGRFATTYIVLFGGEDIDPAQYDAFVRRVLARRPQM
jgi:hypothetical protein